VLPVSIALGPVGTFVQLYILELGGTVIDIALAVTLFNAVSIPAAIIWGFTTDRFHGRKTIIAVSYLMVAATLLLFLRTMTIYGIDLLYSLFSLLSAAAATPLNLLIMETQPKSRWTSAFARFSMISSIGVTGGILLGVAWSDFLPFHLLVVPLAMLSASSALLAALMIKEPSISFERGLIVMVKRSFYELLLALPMLFLQIPRMIDFRRVYKSLRYGLSRDPLLLYASITGFYLSSGIFNTSLVPALYGASLSKSQVFLVSLVGMIVQTASFNYFGPRIEQKSLKQSAFRGLTIRAAGYALIGVCTYFLTGLPYLAATIVLYSLSAGVAYALYYAASNVMIFNTLGKSHQGSVLGVYSALVGFATMLGSFISGLTSYFLGYYVTFILAGILLAGAAVSTSAITAE